MKALLWLAGVCLLGVASCAGEVSQDPGLEEQAAPTGLVSESWPGLAADVTVFGEAGSTKFVEVTALLALGSEPAEYELEAVGEDAYISLTPGRLTLTPGVPSTIEVPIVFGEVGELAVVDVTFTPVVPPFGRHDLGDWSTQVIAEAVAAGAPVPPLVAGETVELVDGVLVDVLANDEAVEGSLDPSSLRIVSVASQHVGVENFSVERGRIRFVAQGPFWDGADLVYEVCDSTGLCSTGSLLGWTSSDG